MYYPAASKGKSRISPFQLANHIVSFERRSSVLLSLYLDESADCPGIREGKGGNVLL